MTYNIVTYDYIKTYIESFGYNLLSKEYISAKTKLLIRCPKGHKYEVKWNSFQQGRRCNECRRNQICDIKSYIESFGYELLSKTYKTNRSKLLIRCPKGHKYEASFTKFQIGRRCPKCNNESKKLTIKIVKEKIESVKGYHLISEKYISSKSKLKIQCPKNHIFKMCWSAFQQGQRCSTCDKEKKTSKAEIVIQEYVKTLMDNVVCNDRTQVLNPFTGHYLELDVWLPDLNKAIEYNGNYYHSIKNVILHDRIKIDECDRIGIKLLIIDEQDYLDDEQAVFTKVNDFIMDRYSNIKEK